MRVAGCLRSLANICKIVPRHVLCPHAPHLLEIIISLMLDKVSKNILLARLRTKLIQRIGLLFCRRRAAAASWRYQRGFRSLADNLSSLMSSQQNGVRSSGDMQNKHSIPAAASYVTSKEDENRMDGDDDDDIEVPEEVAVVIDHLIDALRSKFTCVRWSAAKGYEHFLSLFW